MVHLGVSVYRATWGGAVIAESENTVAVEGNQYFPVGDVDAKVLRSSATHTTCHWKGVASYYDVVVGDQVNRDAAWFYDSPKLEAEMVRNRIAFWHGVKVEAVGEPVA